MEVDPEVSIMTTPMNGKDATKSSVSPTSGSQYILGTSISQSTHQAALPRIALEWGSPTLRSLPSPPVVLITNSDCAAWPKFKLDQLFVEWLARPESRKWLMGLLDDVRAGKTPDLGAEQTSRIMRTERSLSPNLSRSPSAAAPSGLAASSQQAPGSPVSRLFRNHIPFGDSDSSPHSPPNAPPGVLSSFRPSLTPAAADFDLGRSGSASPLGNDQSHAKDKNSVASMKRTISAAHKNSLSTSATGAGGRPMEAGRDSRTQSALTGAVSSLSEECVRRPAADSKALDRVADGIAGMTAAAGKDQAPTQGSGGGRDASAFSRADGESLHSKALSVLSEEKAASAVASSAYGSTGSTSIRGSTPGSTKTSVEKGITVGQGRLEQRGSNANNNNAAIQPDSIPAEALAARTAQTTSLGSSQNELHETLGKATALDSGVSPMDEGLVSSATPPLKPRSVPPKDTSMTDATTLPKKMKSIPRFYFPCGKDAEERESKERQTIIDFFQSHRVQKNAHGVSRAEIAELVADAIGLPSYFASIVFNAILELFPQASAERTRQTPDDRQDVSAPQNEETAMRDVIQRDNGAGQVSIASSVDATPSRNETGGTSSDTTMGDVNDMHTDGRRVNGFHASSGAQVDSTPSVSEPAAAGEGNAVGATQGYTGNETIEEKQFTAYYNKIAANSSREARLFAALREPHANRDYLIPSDFKPLLRALLLCHQGLAFLHATPEFQQRYSETVIERIYFGCTRQHNGRLTLTDIKRSKLLETLIHVDEEEDINRERKYFSYEHFYVLYCRFWELDANHDLQIDREDLMRYGSHSLTYRIVDRIFGGYARPLDCPENPGFMSYTDFIWFCLSEEDKTSDTAIDYWFRCVDMDGDGLITMYDMEFFYTEQLHRMECFGHEPVQIRDILCQLLDMINPNVKPPVIRRRDLKKCKLAGNFFNVLFNLNKFFAIEARDPLQIRQEHATPDLTDWDRFAALEYLRLSAEEEGEEDESWEDVCEAANPLMAGEAPF